MSIHLYLLVHVQSGGHRGQEIFDQLQSACKAQNISYTYRISDYEGHTVTLVKEMAHEIKQSTKEQRLVVIGGDGTLNEAITGLLTSKQNLPIAYFPAGSGNDFARELNLTKSIDRFLQLIQIAPTKEVELLTYESHSQQMSGYALNSIGFGFDAYICQLKKNSSQKSLLSRLGLGKLTYLSKLAKAFKSHSAFSAHLLDDSGQSYHFQQILFIDILNHSYFGGGIRIDPLSKSNDHQVAFLAAHHVKARDIFRIAPKILFTGSHYKEVNHISRQAAKSFSITLDQPAYMQTDGEVYPPKAYDLSISLITYPIWDTSDTMSS